MATKIYKNKKTKQTMIAFTIILSVLSSAFGVYKYYENGMDYTHDVSKTVEIKTEQDFIKYVNDWGKNDTFILKNDIVITSEHDSIGTNKNGFIGTFDGQGYKITIKDDALTSPLFNYIDEGAVIKNLELEYKTTTISTASYSMFSYINKGHIKNCKVSIKDVCVVNNTIFSPVSTFNYGSIENVMVEGNIINRITNDIKPSLLAGISVYNYGTIKNCLSSIIYNGFNVINYDNLTNSNQSIGAIYSSNFGTINNCSALLQKNTYVCDRKDVSISYDKEFLYANEYVFNVLKFDSDVWEENDLNYSLKKGVSI